MTADYASLCFLSFNRPEFIFEAIRSATQNAGYPCEVIVSDDGSTADGLVMGLVDMLAGGEISQLLLHPQGHNEGVGASVKRMFDLATGDPVIKLDQDLLFNDGWLARVVGILNMDPDVAMLGLFKYHHEPVEWQSKRIDVPTKGGYHYTRQFCGSGFAIPHGVWIDESPAWGTHSDAFCEDSEFMEHLRLENYELALPDVDLVHNRGFGYGPSTVCLAPDKVQGIHHEPHLLCVYCDEETGDSTDEHETCVDQSMVEAIDPGRTFNAGVVITTCEGREENLRRVVTCLNALEGVRPEGIVIVHDGCKEQYTGDIGDIPQHAFGIPKHEPGHEQPRNVGFRRLREWRPECNYVWFVDSDIIFPTDTLEKFYEGLCAAEPDRILMGPYDWLSPGVTEFTPEVKDGNWGQANGKGMPDYRWASFNDHGPEDVLVHDLGASLACFSGNLLWPVDRFEEVGGYHPELHHGRCEDGELGLRAGSQGVPMSFVRDARGQHIWHPIDHARALEANRRDVPLINSWHPWMPDAAEGALEAYGLGPEWRGLLVTAADGARFEWKCPDCGQTINTLEYWPHSAKHRSENMDLNEVRKIKAEYVESAPTATEPEFTPGREPTSEIPPPDYIKYMPISEFRELGLVQEINRLILHPLGLALEVRQDESGETLSGIWDFRDDPEGVIFDEGQINPERAADLADAIELRGMWRMRELGYVVQPVDPEHRQLKVSVLEPSASRIGAPGEDDEGEETPAELPRWNPGGTN